MHPRIRPESGAFRFRATRACTGSHFFAPAQRSARLLSDSLALSSTSGGGLLGALQDWDLGAPGFLGGEGFSCLANECN